MMLKDSQTKTNEYRELATMLQTWIREKSAIMSDRSFPSTLIEMKKLAAESGRFRTDEVPVRQRDKTRLQQLFRDLQVMLVVDWMFIDYQTVGVNR